MGWNPSEKRSVDRGHSNRGLRGDTALSGSRAPVVMGSRDSGGLQVPYYDDPIRNRAAAFIPNGYLSPGYDTGRRG